MSMRKVNFAAVDTGAADVHRARERMNQTLNQLETDLSPIARDTSNWDADSAERYRSYQQQWNQAAEELNEVLLIIGKNVDVAGQNYVAAESTNAGMWSS